MVYGFQVGNFIHYLSTFLAGLVVGFVSAWRLALLSVAVIPGIAFAGGLYAYTLTGLTSKSRESYANAGITAEQVRSFLHVLTSFLQCCMNFACLVAVKTSFMFPEMPNCYGKIFLLDANHI